MYGLNSENSDKYRVIHWVVNILWITYFPMWRCYGKNLCLSTYFYTNGYKLVDECGEKERIVEFMGIACGKMTLLPAVVGT